MANSKVDLKAVITAEDKSSLAINSFSKRIGKMGAEAAAVAKKASLAIGTVIGSLTLYSVKSAMDFQQSLNVFKSVSDATATQMAEVAAKARELGKDIQLPGISAKDAAFAMVELSKAGLSVKDTLGASKGVLSLAKAGMLDTGYAAEITANALNAFNLRGTEASRVADILAAAANASSAGVDDMALGMQMASSSASAMKVPVQDLVVVLAEMSNNALKGSDAGTSLKTFLMNMVPTTNKAKKAMRELNLDFFNAKGNFVGLKDVSRQLEKATKSLTDEQRSLAFETIFGSDSVRAANILAKEGVDGFNKMSKAVNRQGAATKLAAAQNSGLKGALDNLKSTLDTVAIDFGYKLLPPIERFVKFITGGIEPGVKSIERIGKKIGDYLEPKIKALTNSVKEASPTFKRLWDEVLQPLSVALGTVFVAAIGLVIDALNILLQVTEPIINYMLNNKGTVVAFAGAFTLLAGAMMFNAVFNALTLGFQFFRLITIPKTMASVTAFRALVMSPMVMGAIGISAALIAAGLVYDAWTKAQKAIDASIQSARNQQKSDSAVVKRLQKQEKEGKTADLRHRATEALNKIYAGNPAASGQFASGGFTGRGSSNQVAGIVHKGEYVLPKSQVDQNTGRPKVSSQPQQINITIQAGAFMGTRQDARKFAMYIQEALMDAQRAKGMAV